MEGGSFSSGHLLWHVKPSRNAALARCPRPHISTQWGPFSALSLQIGCRTIIYPRLQPSPQPASPIGCHTDCVFSRHIVHPASLMQPHACCRQALWIPWLTHHFTHLLARPRPSPSLPAACHLLDRRAARPHPPRCTAMTMTPGSLFFLASMDTAACGDDDEAGAAAPAVVRSWPTSWRWRRPTLSLSPRSTSAPALPSSLLSPASYVSALVSSASASLSSLRLRFPLHPRLVPLRLRLLRLLAMVFGEGSATARGRSSSSVAAELRRPALRPLLLPPLVPSYGGGAGGRLRGGETTGLARSGGLDLGPWRRQLELAASMSG